MKNVGKFFRLYPMVAAILTVAAVGGVLHFTVGPLATQILITSVAAIYALWTAIGMVRDIMRGHFGLDILALIAIVATIAVGEYWASLIVMLMLSGGEALEDYAANRAKRELTALLDRTPTVAHLLARAGESPAADEAVLDIPVEEVQVGDILLVRPAELVPVDAKLLSITGEALPVDLVTGAEVPSGSINGASAVQMEALLPASESQYQQIIALVQDSEQNKAPVVRVADRFAIPFTAVSLLIAGAAWIISGDPVRFAEVLVLATPCPLLIAAPVAFMGGMSRAARHGIIVKGGAALEVGANIHSAGFDKTGTLTGGQPRVVGLQTATAEISSDVLLQTAASAEQYSAHVLAAGIREAAAAQKLRMEAAEKAEEITGHGVEAIIGGELVRAGRLDFIQQKAPQAEGADLHPGQGAVYVSRGTTYLGAIVLADEIRPEAAEVIGWLGDHHVENIVMVTGDEQATADEVANHVGITNVKSSLRPGEKVAIIRDLEPKKTMMVGDGVNDAPVLAAADLGVAMGAKGSSAAGEAADAVILRDSLELVASLLTISRQTMQVALTAIWIGIVLSVALMLVATTGVIPAVVGAFTQELLDLICILYALRALGGKLPTFTKATAAPSEKLEAAVVENS